MTTKLSLKTISSNLLVYGIMHGVVDAICAGVIFTIFRNKIVGTQEFLELIILYNILAFGLQAILGLVVDYLKSPRAAALVGCVLTGISAFVFLHSPILAIVFAGIGNALFHIGGGSVSLNLTPGKASAPGIFVAPGAIGLLLGTMLGGNGQFIVWPFILALIALCLLMFVIKTPGMNYEKEEIKESRFSYFELIIFLILLSVAIRSLVGTVLVFPWKADVNLLIILTFAVVLGKGLGGVLADKLGWIRVGVGSLVLSIPFLVFGASIPFVAIIGIFLFNITMPITLVAISNILSGRSGFSFGLTCLALVVGAFPTFIGFNQLLDGRLFVFTLIFISSVTIFYGLRQYFASEHGE